MILFALLLCNLKFGIEGGPYGLATESFPIAQIDLVSAKLQHEQGKMVKDISPQSFQSVSSSADMEYSAPADSN